MSQVRPTLDDPNLIKKMYQVKYIKPNPNSMNFGVRHAIKLQWILSTLIEGFGPKSTSLSFIALSLSLSLSHRSNNWLQITIIVYQSSHSRPQPVNPNHFLVWTSLFCQAMCHYITFI